jgi:hypothetical protein
VVTGWGGMVGEGAGRGNEWMRRDRKNSWEVEQWNLAQDKEGK